jgi:hypothetical protein
LLYFGSAPNSRAPIRWATSRNLAVLAMERGYVPFSTNADFSRFAVRWINPCKS